MRRFTILMVFCLVTGASLLARAGGALQVSDAWLRAMPPGQPNGAAYMVLHNAGVQPLTIVGVSSELAQRVEIHESRQEDGMWRMRALESLAVPAGGTEELAPGGRHLMLFGIQRPPAEGEEVTFRLTLQGGEQVVVKARVRGLAADGDHKHHHHNQQSE